MFQLKREIDRKQFMQVFSQVGVMIYRQPAYRYLVWFTVIYFYFYSAVFLSHMDSLKEQIKYVAWLRSWRDLCSLSFVVIGGQVSKLTLLLITFAFLGQNRQANLLLYRRWLVLAWFLHQYLKNLKEMHYYAELDANSLMHTLITDESKADATLFPNDDNRCRHCKAHRRCKIGFTRFILIYNNRAFVLQHFLLSDHIIELFLQFWIL